MEKKSKKRKIAAAGAVVLALVLALSGTFAWQSLNQEALNRAEGTQINPGGRLHDDFNGSNKDVYVENFGDQKIIARVRLDEYMEINGQSVLKTGNKPSTAPIKADKSTWTTFKPTSGNYGNGNSELRTYWSWSWGGKTTFMPTFNMNKDSLKADINGKYDSIGEDGQHYADYKTYNVGDKLTAYAQYDNDDNDVDEGNYTQVTEEHTAKDTQTSTVISMKTWKDEKKQAPGKYWIYDTDGWAYWGEAVEPKEATGLLLTSIYMTDAGKRKITGNWYYGINVVSQFATTDDIGSKEALTRKGFYDTDKGTAPSADAELLLNQLKTTAEKNSAPLSKGLSDQIRAADQTQFASTQGDASKTVTIDGTDFYVLNVDANKNQALLLAKNAERTDRAFNKDQNKANINQWKDSDMRIDLRGWLVDRPTVSKSAVEMNLNTRPQYNSADTSGSIVTKDKVFLLSEADVFGTFNGSATSDVKDYSLGVAKTIVPEKIKKATNSKGKAQWWWLRSPRGNSSVVVGVNSGGTWDSSSAYNTAGAVRPALVVNLTPAGK